MKTKIYFVIGSHKSITGIYSYFKIVKKVFSNCNIEISNQIKKKSINIIIENFSSDEVAQVIDYKMFKETKIILIVTEFYNDKLDTFNTFELNNILNLKVKTLFFNFFLSFLKFRFFIKKRIKDFLKKYFNFNIIEFRKFKKKINLPIKIMFFDKIRGNNLLVSYERYFYFKKRYINYRKIINCADIILTSHPAIFKECKLVHKKVFYIMPKLKIFIPNKELGFLKIFKFSGDLNNYRKNFFLYNKNFFENFNLGYKKNLKKFFNKIKNYEDNSFINISTKEKYKYSLHPKKNEDWPYSSPIRYIDAINNGEIPLIFDKFNDFFARNLAIYINFKSPKSLEKFNDKYYINNVKKLKNGILKYNKLIDSNNKLLHLNLKKILKNIK